MVNNYGERPGLFGKLQRYADESYRARNSALGQYMKGCGIMPEGLNNNPVSYDVMLELGWHKEHVNIEDWVRAFTMYRYGQYNTDVVDAWKLLLQTVYNSIPGYQEGPPENILCARPALQIKSVSSWGTLKKGYDIEVFSKAVRLFAKAAPAFKASDTYHIDLVDLLRQVLANKADTVFASMVTAYNEKNSMAFDKAANHFLQLCSLTDTLLNTHPYYRLSTWQQQAMNAGNTKKEKTNNMLNLMMLITYWGEHNPKEDYLHEYAYKEWSGMMNSFYKKRWEIYFEYLRKQMKGEQPVAPDFFEWERSWVRNNLFIKKETKKKSPEKIVNKILFDK
jgi:alpha-N-acetylglucosaminidase